MIEKRHGTSRRQSQLESPTRNNYFYGKLLDVFHLEMEQDYFNRKRWLLNRLGLGTGVLCGLEVERMRDDNSILVKPGVAIDALGRLIIVPRDYCLKNQEFQPGEEYTLCLAYHECQIEPVPVLVGDCDTEQACAPSTIRDTQTKL